MRLPTLKGFKSEMIALDLALESSKKTRKRKQQPGVLQKNTPWWDVMEALWEVGTRRILLAGPPGTGKSKTASLLLETDYRVTMTEGTAVEDMLGCFQLRKKNENDKTAVTEWADGPVPRAMKESKGILVDEIDKMPPEIQSLMYAVMDDQPEIMLPTGEKVLPSDGGYGVIATTNANVAVLPEALIDRFDAVLCAVTPHEDAISHLPVAEKACVVNYYKGMQKERWLWAGKTTVRRMRSFYALRKSGQFADALAGEVVFGRSAQEIISALATAAR